MKSKLISISATGLVAALNLAAAISCAQAQTDSGYYRPMTLAPANEPSADGGAKVDDENAQKTDLLKKSLNPLASLISLPIQNNWDFGIGPEKAMKYTANVQPVVPISIGKDWNLITRTIIPVIYQESRFPGDGRHGGLGDILQSFFLSPSAPVKGWTVGGGVAMLYPNATDPVLGGGKWGAGPTFIVLRQDKDWTYGLLANHVWPYAGWGEQNVVSSFLQPFISYSTKTFTTFLVNSESTYDWQSGQWLVPLNFSVSQLLKIGKQPISLQMGYRYYAQSPDGGPEWGIRFGISFLFPKHK